MSIGREEVLHVARLAELAVGEGEVDKLVEQMNRIVDYVAQLDLVPADHQVAPFLPGPAQVALREDTPDVHLNPDGSFQAFVPVREGTNRLLVNAVASDGSVANVELAFQFQVAQQEGRMRERELEQLRQLNTELLRHVEAERIKREKRRMRVQKEIEIRASEP